MSHDRRPSAPTPDSGPIERPDATPLTAEQRITFLELECRELRAGLDRLWGLFARMIDVTDGIAEDVYGEAS